MIYKIKSYNLAKKKPNKGVIFKIKDKLIKVIDEKEQKSNFNIRSQLTVRREKKL